MTTCINWTQLLSKVWQTQVAVTLHKLGLRLLQAFSSKGRPASRQHPFISIYVAMTATVVHKHFYKLRGANWFSSILNISILWNCVTASLCDVCVVLLMWLGELGLGFGRKDNRRVRFFAVKAWGFDFTAVKGCVSRCVEQSRFIFHVQWNALIYYGLLDVELNQTSRSYTYFHWEKRKKSFFSANFGSSIHVN